MRPVISTRLIRRRRRMRRLATTVAVVVVLAGVAGYRLVAGDDGGASAGASVRVSGLRPCDVPLDVLERVARGYYPRRSGDVMVVDWVPNQFAGLRHSTPHPYTQNVPLVLYGPGFVRAGATPGAEATVADLAPTYAELLGFDEWPERDGRVLSEALLPRAERPDAPRLIFHLVWDGGGDDVLEQWPDAWPNLRRMMARGASYADATVGSSPSITPAVHSTMGTGAWPSRHGITDMVLRDRRGKIVLAFGEADPRYLLLPTIGDLWDRANGNVPLVGFMAKDSYHLGMLGHGAGLPGGDHDVAVIDKAHTIAFRTNEELFTLPDYVTIDESLDAAVAEIDQRDGEADGKWLGHELDPTNDRIRYSPVWPVFQTQKMIEVLTNEGFGADDVPDLFFANVKSTDLVGHEWNMAEPEERDTLREQDRQLAVLLDALDRLVGRGNYVVALTADHGMNPYPSTTGGWAIDSGEVTADVERRFDRPGGRPIVNTNRGYQLMLNRDELRRSGVTAADVARFVRAQTIRDNVRDGEPVPEAFRDRADERLFMTALTPAELDAALSCARRGAGG